MPPHRDDHNDLKSAAAIEAAAVPLPRVDDPAQSPFSGPFANALAVQAEALASHRVVLLGESTHGTAEFYRARAALTAQLVARHGFRIVAVEADWPDAAAVDRHVRGRPAQPAEAPAGAFTRFPVWMWRNLEVARFIRWLHAHNAALAPAQRAGRPDSYEHLFHQAGHAQCWLDLRGARSGALDDARNALLPPRQERFIGVIYRPETELQSHYARATLPRQFDALLWFDRSRAVPAFPASPAPARRKRGRPDYRAEAICGILEPSAPTPDSHTAAQTAAPRSPLATPAWRAWPVLRGRRWWKAKQGKQA